MTRCFIIIALTVLASCIEQPAERPVSQYYNMDSLLNAQHKVLLNGAKRISKKTAEMRKGVEVELDSITLANELSMFRAINLRKPSLQGQYKVVEGNDADSNLSLKIYQAKSPDQEVEYVEVYYLNELNNIRKIRAKLSSHSMIYDAEKYITLKFDRINDKITLTNYLTTGFQKMIFQDSVNYNIFGKLKY